MSDPHPEPLRILQPGYGLWVTPMIFNARITVGPIGSFTVDGGWCYHTVEAAVAAAFAWDPEQDDAPRGWHKEVHTGRTWRYVEDPALPCAYCCTHREWDGHPLGPDGELLHEITPTPHEACSLAVAEHASVSR